MSSAELHSLISQLQGEHDSELAYEVDIGAPAFDKERNFWVENDARIPIPQGKRGQYVPHWDATKKYKDYSNNPIQDFNYKSGTVDTKEAKRNSLGDIDFAYYIKPTAYMHLVAMLNWEIAKSREMMTEHHKEVKKLKEQHNETKNVFPPSITYVRSNNHKAHGSTAHGKTRTPQQEAEHQVALAEKKARHAAGQYNAKEIKHHEYLLAKKEKKLSGR